MRFVSVSEKWSVSGYVVDMETTEWTIPKCVLAVYVDMFWLYFHCLINALHSSERNSTPGENERVSLEKQRVAAPAA